MILGPRSVAWVWRNCDKSGRVLQDLAEARGGLGESQTRRLIMEYRARQAFCDFGPWSYAFRQLLNNTWGQELGPEWEPSWIDCEPWTATCYVATTRTGKTLEPEEQTLPGWSGANQIPLKIERNAMRATVNFNPEDRNMACQLVYRDKDGHVHYSRPVKNGPCSITLKDVMNNVVIAVICNTDYVFEGDSTRHRKYGYTLDLGSGIKQTADIHTRWYDYTPDEYCIDAAAGSNGRIKPSGAVSVDDGAEETFTFIPDRGYEVDQVMLNGFPIGSMENYTFRDIHGDHSIAVTFKRK